jgi:hypothetical protein
LNVKILDEHHINNGDEKLFKKLADAAGFYWGYQGSSGRKFDDFEECLQTPMANLIDSNVLLLDFQGQWPQRRLCHHLTSQEMLIPRSLNHLLDLHLLHQVSMSCPFLPNDQANRPKHQRCSRPFTNSQRWSPSVSNPTLQTIYISLYVVIFSTAP